MFEYHHGKMGKLTYDGLHIIIHPTANIDLTGNVTIGDYVTISQDVKIWTHKHHWRTRGLRRQNNEIERINLEIGRDAFIGANALVIGVNRIGEGAVIGAGSVVTHDVPDWEVWGGNPAHKIGTR